MFVVRLRRHCCDCWCREGLEKVTEAHGICVWKGRSIGWSNATFNEHCSKQIAGLNVMVIVFATLHYILVIATYGYY